MPQVSDLGTGNWNFAEAEQFESLLPQKLGPKSPSSRAIIALSRLAFGVGRNKRQSCGVRRLLAALPLQHGILVNRHRKTANIPFQFQVKPAETTNVVRRAKSPEKESGDESPHSKGR